MPMALAQSSTTVFSQKLFDTWAEESVFYTQSHLLTGSVEVYSVYIQFWKAHCCTGLHSLVGRVPEDQSWRFTAHG